MMSVARLTTNFVNYVRLHVLCLMMPLWTLVQAFISCRLDYCNALLCGIYEGLVQRLQSVQNRQLGWSLELVDESTSRRC